MYTYLYKYCKHIGRYISSSIYYALYYCSLTASYTLIWITLYMYMLFFFYIYIWWYVSARPYTKQSVCMYAQWTQGNNVYINIKKRMNIDADKILAIILPFITKLYVIPSCLARRRRRRPHTVPAKHGRPFIWIFFLKALILFLLTFISDFSVS